jgi:hypothetical protein
MQSRVVGVLPQGAIREHECPGGTSYLNQEFSEGYHLVGREVIAHFERSEDLARVRFVPDPEKCFSEPEPRIDLLGLKLHEVL